LNSSCLKNVNRIYLTYAFRKNMNHKPKSILLFSGGLDSILAVEILRENKVNVVGATFVSPFFSEENAKVWAETLSLDLIKVDFTDDMISLLKNPPHGFGKNLNPCIDCHSRMLERAGEIMEEKNFDFISTGEVVGERPFSQNKQALETVARASRYEHKILRPLSAKLLSPTHAEKFIPRQNLYDISGRGREKQFALARKFNIKKYPSPGGGCRLTEAGFCRKLKTLMEHKSNFQKKDLEILSHSKQIYFDSPSYLALGRNKAENDFLKSHQKKGDLFFDSGSYSMPSAILRLESEESKERRKSILEESKRIILSASKKGNMCNFQDLEFFAR